QVRCGVNDTNYCANPENVRIRLLLQVWFTRLMDEALSRTGAILRPAVCGAVVLTRIAFIILPLLLSLPLVAEPDNEQGAVVIDKYRQALAHQQETQKNL